MLAVEGEQPVVLVLPHVVTDFLTTTQVLQ